MSFAFDIRKAAALVVALSSLAASSSAITLGQVDDFQDGTIQNWAGASPQNVDNGQGGAGDRYLRLVSTGGFGQGSHMACYNPVQWAGDYTAAGVTSVAVDFKNEGATTLEMRAVMFGPLGSRWVTNSSIVLPPDGIWRRFVFSLSEANMVQVLAGDTYQQVMSGCARFMFRHDPDAPSATGVPVVATLGIDNVTALGPANVNPQSFSLFRGLHLSGGLSDLFNSDDSYLVLQPGPTLNLAEAPLQLTLSGTSPVTAPSAFQFKLEARANVTGLNQSILLFNFSTNAYETMDVRGATTSDSVVVVVPTGNLSRFVNASTSEVRARITYKQVGPVGVFPWTVRVDQAQWRIGP
jgi:hypothetical protein